MFGCKYVKYESLLYGMILACCYILFSTVLQHKRILSDILNEYMEPRADVIARDVLNQAADKLNISNEQRLINIMAELYETSSSNSSNVFSQNKLQETLMKEMERCSLSMGIPAERLRRDTLMNVSERAVDFLSAFKNFMPNNFSKTYRNPCWHAKMTLPNTFYEQLRKVRLTDNNLKDVEINIMSITLQLRNHITQLYCLPYFYLAGFPRSGTTTLHNTIKSHMKIIKPAIKEPQWWTNLPLRRSDTDFLRVIIMRYLLYFSSAANVIEKKHDVLTYDASQSLLFRSIFTLDNQDYCALPAVISRITPKAKFIIIMRNPIERLYSAYFYACSLQIHRTNISLWPEVMQRNAPENFHVQVVSEIEFFKKCKTRLSVFECTALVNNHTDVTINSHTGAIITNHSDQLNNYTCGSIGQGLTVGLYHIHIKKWMKFFPKKNFLLLKMEDLVQKPQKHLLRIIRFLDLQEMPRGFIESFKVVSNAQGAFSKDSDGFDMLPKTQRLLKKFYRPYNAKLAKLAGNDDFKWKHHCYSL